MNNHVSQRVAPGGPGIEPRWTRGAKSAVGTAYSTSSRLWYTLERGTVTEVYYPTIDSPQIRDLQFLFTDGETFFHDERRNFRTEIDCVSEAALGFEVTNREEEGRYKIHKTILGDPHQNCLLMRTRLEAPLELLSKLRMYVLCAPHLEIGGWHNNGQVLEIKGRKFLAAYTYKGGTWLVIGATIPFTESSCGYVGVNDGWTDLADNYRLDWQYDAAPDGNIALTGGFDLSRGTEFTVGLAFGTTRHDALSSLLQSLSIPFEHTREAFIHQWERTSKRFALVGNSPDGKLFERSVNVLLAHEDKTYPGAMIASLSIPWGDEKSDEELGGYHLVWTRDMVKCVSALLAVGDYSTPLRALIYLAVSQREDGGFHQNFWIDGRPYWMGIQLDEVAFPILLAWRLWKHGALGNFDPYPMVRSACGFLIREGPVTAQDRWEEASGYSPSTLAVHIAALICAAEFFADRGEQATAEFVRDYADFLESHIERWTVTTMGTLVPGISRHYIRINPGIISHCADEDPNCGTLTLSNRPPVTPYEFPAKDIVDGGFLELVRYGIRSADDPIIQDSLRVIDAVLKVETPYGPCWRRYNYDGYGQRDDGGPYKYWGTGRAWPLLTGERGHYEIAAGRDPGPYLRALEKFAQGIGLIPEQVWDAPDLPARHLHLGGPTGSALPLLWAHAEYVKLQRSAADGKIFDLIEASYDRYVAGGRERQAIEIWKFNRQVPAVPAGTLLRVQATSSFLLHWTSDEWQHPIDTRSKSTALGIEFVDLQLPDREGQISFTFLWLDQNKTGGKARTTQLNYRLAPRRGSEEQHMANPQAASREARIVAPAAIIEANTATRVYRGEPAADQEQLESLCINTIRTLAMDAVQKANSGHPGTPMALAPAAFVLWDRHLRHNPANPQWPNRDRFILSNGHASMLLYSLLYLTGYGLTLQELENFRQWGSRTPGHPEYGLTPGVETTTGPLGQGVSNSVGMAIAERWLAAHFNREGQNLIDYRVYAFCGDGDLMEGISQEAASVAGHLGLSNLIWIYDNNRITIEGHTALAFSDDVAARFMAYHWNVLRVGDANDLELIDVAIRTAQKEQERPSLIILDSHIAWGAPNKHDTSAAHGEPLGEDEIRLAKQAYGWPPDEHFLVPPEVFDYMHNALRRGDRWEREWNQTLTGFRHQHPELAAEWDMMQRGELPPGWDADIPTFSPDAKGKGTRDSGSTVENAIAKDVPWFIGGSADLAPSTKTLIAGAGDFESDNYRGRNFHFGIREHSMGAILNGLALSKLRVFGSTFLIFSDYMRPAIRLSALMDLPVTYVFTHDSIGLGEDGPTHQPIEQLMSLRLIPRLVVIRPADANEAAEAWKVAMKSKEQPIVLVLTRQAVPTFDHTKYASADGLQRGAYILADAPGEPQVILMATGSEVQLCVEAHEQLKSEGFRSRVVSMPSWELFKQQSEEYRNSVLPPQVHARVAVEAGTGLGWREYVGSEGRVIARYDFGASAPIKDLLKHFGFTAERVACEARSLIKR